MKLIFICTDYYPYTGPCSSLLNKLFFNGLSANFPDIHVISVKKELHENEFEIIDRIQIHRVLNWRAIPFHNIKSQYWKHMGLSLEGIISKVIIKIREKNSFTSSIVVNKIYKKLLEITEGKDCIIIPIAGEFDTVKAAMKYKTKYGGKLIVYQVDPCSTNQSYSMNSYRKRFSLEKEMRKHADKIVTTKIIIEETASMFPQVRKGSIIPMEFPNVAPIHTGFTNTGKTTSPFVCVYAGLIYKAARNPAYTLRLFSALNTQGIILKMVGVERGQMDEYIDEKLIANNIEFMGIVPYQKARKYVEEGDVLVNIGNILTNQVPSKLFEYISMGKPIVNVCVNHKCPTIDYLKSYPYVLNLYEDEYDNFENHCKLLREFIFENAGKRVSAEWITKEYYDCTAKYCSQKWVQLITEIN